MERFWTSEEIEAEIDKVSGTWVKRRNLREKLKAKNNHHVGAMSLNVLNYIRALKANGSSEQDLRELYSKVSNLELKRL